MSSVNIRYLTYSTLDCFYRHADTLLNVSLKSLCNASCFKMPVSVPAYDGGLGAAEESGLLVQVESACKGGIWIHTVAEGSRFQGTFHTAVVSWGGIPVASDDVTTCVLAACLTCASHGIHHVSTLRMI